MTLTFIDLILALLVFGFVLFGFYYGFIHTIGSLIGIVVALVITGYITPFLITWLEAFLNTGAIFQSLLFLVLFLIIFRLIGFFFWVIEKTIGILAALPFISTIDRLIGTVLGFIEGVFVAGVLIQVIVAYFAEGKLFDAVVNSELAQWITEWTSWAIVWLPI